MVNCHGCHWRSSQITESTLANAKELLIAA
ncbi:Uncharacterised protein [Vibrio cholerae]|nr:Uncharacterised protein [Vibrio cholerae]